MAVDDQVLAVLRDHDYSVMGYGSARTKGWAVSSDAAVHRVADDQEISVEEARILIRRVVDESGGYVERKTIESKGLRPRRPGERPLSVDVELFFVALA